MLSSANTISYGIIKTQKESYFMPFPMICTYCNQEYFVKKNSERLRSKYCSRVCFFDAKARLVSVNGEIHKTCAKCGIVKPFSDYHKATKQQTGARTICKLCASAHMKIYAKENYAHRQKVTMQWRDSNREHLKSWARIKHQNLRLEVIKEYGGACACCGVSEHEFLAIDHIFNDGKDERKVVGTSTRFYRFLKKNNYPKDRYQILCHNCNMAKAFYGVCPHKKEG